MGALTNDVLNTVGLSVSPGPINYSITQCHVLLCTGTDVLDSIKTMYIHVHHVRCGPTDHVIPIAY